MSQDPRQVTWEKAEAKFGKRLDRRLAYAIIDDEVCELVKCTTCCSGCTEVPEMTSAPEQGMGCYECGYTGKTVQRHWVPATSLDFKRELRNDC